MQKLLIIDPLRGVRNALKERLEYEGYIVETAEECHQALELIRDSIFDAILVDAGIFMESSEQARQTGSGFCEHIPKIVLSADNDVDTAVRCMRLGAVDFLPKPIDLNKLLISLKEAGQTMAQRMSAYHPDGQLKKPCEHEIPEERIIGHSRQIVHVRHLIERVAPSDARVLITGSNGTGKELVARGLHEKSHRAKGPFVEVNCAAIPSELIESELFGHEKGAFTSAIKQRKGKFEQANSGTLFLDEIGDMSLSAQAKVLRVLQEHRLSRVGSDMDVEVDVRVVAATNKNLIEEIREGRFREDLYHRLSVIVIMVPPLEERLEDIPILSNYFITKICSEHEIPCKPIEPEAIEELQKMSWSGNIRELRNVIERLIILSEDVITVSDVREYASGII